MHFSHFLGECSQPVAPTRSMLIGNTAAPYVIGTRISFVCERCYQGGGSILCTTVGDRVAWETVGFCNSKYSCLILLHANN